VTILEDLFEDFRTFLPKYLTPSDKRELFDALSSYPNLPYHYLSPGDVQEELLQGDGWRGFVLINFHTLEKKNVSGVILSNSCDIDIRNSRASRVLFCPLVSLRRYEDALREGGLSDDQIRNTLQDIRAQHVTYIYYLPKEQYGPEESVLVLDDVHSHPLADFLAQERSILFRLSQAAFYVLLIKLSIHFTRSQEGVRRFARQRDLA
jgi:hypothetical protein